MSSPAIRPFNALPLPKVEHDRRRVLRYLLFLSLAIALLPLWLNVGTARPGEFEPRKLHPYLVGGIVLAVMAWLALMSSGIARSFLARLGEEGKALCAEAMASPVTRRIDAPSAMRKLSLAVPLATFAVHNAAFGAEFNMMEQVADGGGAIVLTLGLSILFLAVTIERLVNFRARHILPDGLVERVKPLWSAQEFGKAQQLLSEQDSTLARVLAYVVTHRHHGYAVVSSGAGDVASIELRHHQQKAYALAIVATVAPIVGLLGTVVGMIEAFHVIAFADGMGNPALLAGGISKALINTACGLVVALPSLAMHHFFKNRQAFFGLALEKQVSGLLSEWFLRNEVPSPPLHMVPHAN